jgi:hypothetical protein
MEMTKQTAIQWLASELSGHLGPSNGPELLGILNKALAMEKEQIIEAFQEGQWSVITSEEYYNKTFRGVDD